MTDHQYTVLSFWLSLAAFLIAAAVPWLWFKRRLDLVGKKQVADDLKDIVEFGEQTYAEKQTGKMFFSFGLGGYLLSFSFVFAHLGLRTSVDAFLAFAAAICFLVAGIFGRATTVFGVREKEKALRKQLKKDEKPNP